jgi:uncharacterized protein (DUF1015 family)
VLELLPFDGDVVVADQAHRVVAPPYDALAPAARAALAAADPDSYLGALPPGTAADGGQLDAALARSRVHLARLVAAGRYRPIGGPAIGVLALGSGVDRAFAVIGDVPVAAFAALAGGGGAGGAGASASRAFAPDDGLVRPHELVDEARVTQLARYLEVVGVASSPVALTQHPRTEVTAAVAAVTERPPDLAYRADDGVDVALWCVTEAAVRDRLVTAVALAGPAFLADGHHRGAAAVRHAAAVGAGRQDPAGRVFCAVLPTDHLRVHAFHRRLEGVLSTDPSGEVPARLAGLTAAGVGVTALDGPRAPTARHHLTLTAAGRWWDLDVTALVRDDDPVEALDVTLVERDLLPLLRPPDGSLRPATPVAAPLGLDALVEPGAVGLALHPPELEEVLDIASAGRSLPPKTTYVTPKLRSGLVVTPRGRTAGADRPRR